MWYAIMLHHGDISSWYIITMHHEDISPRYIIIYIYIASRDTKIVYHHDISWWYITMTYHHNGLWWYIVMTSHHDISSPRSNTEHNTTSEADTEHNKTWREHQTPNTPKHSAGHVQKPNTEHTHTHTRVCVFRTTNTVHCQDDRVCRMTGISALPRKINICYLNT